MNLLLHICCANCAIYPVQRLRSLGINWTGLWFNPNIHPFEEYSLRLGALKRLSEEWRFSVMYNNLYDMNLFMDRIMERPEAPLRCGGCYRLRLEETARMAKKEGFDGFTTTLLVSPYQRFELITQVGRELAERYNIEFFVEDFRPGYREAMRLSRELGLYRQKYCGCILSRDERLREVKGERSR